MAEEVLSAVRGRRVAYPDGVRPVPRVCPEVRVSNYNGDGWPEQRDYELIRPLVLFGSPAWKPDSEPRPRCGRTPRAGIPVCRL